MIERRVRVCVDDEDGFPLMLNKRWFTKTNAGLLRAYLRELILSLFIDQAPNKEIPAVIAAVTEHEDLKLEKPRYALIVFRPVCNVNSWCSISCRQ